MADDVAPKLPWWSSPWALRVRGVLPYIVAFGLAYIVQQIMPQKREVLSGLGFEVTAFHSKLLLAICINIVMAVSLNIVNGYTGQFSLGHAGFMAIGGYVAGAITFYGSHMIWGSAEVRHGFLGTGELLFVASLIAGGLAAAVAGYLVGLPSLRLRGDYLAIVTLGFGEIVRVLIQQTGPVLATSDSIAAASPLKMVLGLGGALGFDGIPKYTNLFWAFFFAALTLIVSYRLKHSIHGKAFLAVRESEIAAEAMGVPTTVYKVRAFTLAAFFAGIGGGLFAHAVGVLINPNELNFQKSIDYVIMVVLGGMGSISGATISASVLTVLPETLRGFADYRLIVYAAVLILMMILRPQGLFGVHEMWDLPILRRLRRKRAAHA